MHALAAPLLLGALAACGPEGGSASFSNAPAIPSPTIPSTPASGSSRDGALAAAVHRQLAQTPAVNLQVDVSAGQVRLRGAVPDTQARLQAAAQAARVPGVHRVDNQLSVQLAPIPPAPPLRARVHVGEAVGLQGAGAGPAR